MIEEKRSIPGTLESIQDFKNNVAKKEERTKGSDVRRESMESLSRENKGHILLGGCELFIHQYLMRHRKHTQDTHTPHSKQTPYLKEHQSYIVLNSDIFPNASNLTTSGLKNVTSVLLREVAVISCMTFGAGGTNGGASEMFISSNKILQLNRLLSEWHPILSFYTSYHLGAVRKGR